MSQRKKMRVIDRRNNFYGRYKYQVKLGRLTAPLGEVLNWCEEQWGPRINWIHTGAGSMYRTDNDRWKTHRRGRFSGSTELYLQSDAEATLFTLRWAE